MEGDPAMPHDLPLVTALVAALVLSFVFGAVANRVRVPPLVGYLIAGIVVGPHTPGFVADQALVPQLAELGVILLMFGVGLHFSLKDLMSVARVAVPGALIQIVAATALGFGMALALGWTVGAGLVFGLALSVASTVVMVRALQDRRLTESHDGRVAIGWLIVQDLVMVLTLVLLPPLADAFGGGGGVGGAQTETDVEVLDQTYRVSIAEALAITLAKVVAFVALMLLVGRRLVPWLLHYVAHTGSRELFRLAVLSVALGVAFGAAELFDVSLALGAFFAGMIMSESPLSQRAAEESLPLRDAFSVLFFVAVGMLFDPMILVEQTLLVAATLMIIIVGKTAITAAIVLAFRGTAASGLTIAASQAQIGEFSFILAGLGVALGLLPAEVRDLVLAGAILSILLNPLLFFANDRVAARLARRAAARAAEAPPVAEAEAEPWPDPIEPAHVSTLTGHTVLVGYGRVGSLVGAALRAAGEPFVVIEDAELALELLHEQEVETIVGNGAKGSILEAANVAAASRLLVAIPNAFEAGQILLQARAANPAIETIARAHSDAEVEHLTQLGADLVIMGEREIAQAMIQAALVRAELGSAGGAPGANDS